MSKTQTKPAVKTAAKKPAAAAKPARKAAPKKATSKRATKPAKAAPSASAQDEAFLRRAMELAVQGRGHVEPNPMVGCVIVAKNGSVVGEGYHKVFGEAHAEPNALAAAAADRKRVHGATVYVTLEPCCHEDKETPPCAPRLISAKVARVVIGCLDPNPKVNGEGVRQLKDAGIDVTVVAGALGDECKQLVAPFHALKVLGRPYVTLKWAVSRDGKVAGRMGRPVKISNNAAVAAVHVLRGRVDAIAVGTNTVRNDDPLLTARTVDPPRKPTRVVLSNRLAFPPEAKLFHTPRSAPTIIYTVSLAASGREGSKLRKAGVEVVGLPGHDDGRGGQRFAMEDVFADLAGRGMTHLLVEPGPKLAKELLARGQADRVWVLRGKVDIGDDGMTAPRLDWPEVGRVALDGDVLGEFLNPASQAFFAALPSPDLLRVADGQSVDVPAEEA